jgi:hypothetical protein
MKMERYTSVMRIPSLLLAPVALVALGCSSVAEPGTSTSSDLAAARATPYREVERVFNRLDAADGSGCRSTFRFLNDNWMDCVVDLDRSAFPLQNIAHETLPIRSFSFPTEERGISLEVRVEEVTAWSELPTMRLFVSAYYKKAGEVTIHQMPAEQYSCDRLVDTLTKAFAELSRDDTYASRMIALTGPAFEHPLATDRILGDLYVARRTVSLERAGCKAGYYDGMTDSWPDPDHWTSYCTVSTPGSRHPLPLTNDHWSARLTTLAKTDPIILRIGDVGARPGTTPTVTIWYGDGGYTIEFAVVDDATGEPEDASIPWDRAERLLSRALEDVHEVTWPLLMKESESSTLLPGERIEGRLVLRGRKMDVE